MCVWVSVFVCVGSVFVCVCSVLVPGINGHPAEAGPEMYVCVRVCVCVGGCGRLQFQIFIDILQ